YHQVRRRSTQRVFLLLGGEKLLVQDAAPDRRFVFRSRLLYRDDRVQNVHLGLILILPGGELTLAELDLIDTEVRLGLVVSNGSGDGYSRHFAGEIAPEHLSQSRSC